MQFVFRCSLEESLASINELRRILFSSFAAKMAFSLLVCVLWSTKVSSTSSTSLCIAGGEGGGGGGEGDGGGGGRFLGWRTLRISSVTDVAMMGSGLFLKK